MILNHLFAFHLQQSDDVTLLSFLFKQNSEHLATIDFESEPYFGLPFGHPFDSSYILRSLAVRNRLFCEVVVLETLEREREAGEVAKKLGWPFAVKRILKYRDREYKRDSIYSLIEDEMRYFS